MFSTDTRPNASSDMFLFVNSSLQSLLPPFLPVGLLLERDGTSLPSYRRGAPNQQSTAGVFPLDTLDCFDMGLGLSVKLYRCFPLKTAHSGGVGSGDLGRVHRS